MDSSLFKSLVNDSPGIRLSILMPTHRSGRDVKQGPIQLKTLLQDARWLIDARNQDAAALNEQLPKLEALIEDHDFWQHQSDGLALYLTDRDLFIVRVDVALEPRIMLSRRFLLKPLLPAVHRVERYFVLAISQKNVRLVEYDGEARLRDVPDLPRSIQELLQYVDAEKQMQFHTATAPAPGRRSAMFFGSGDASNDKTKQRIFEYFRMIDDAVADALPDGRTPLVFAGVRSLFPIYQDASRIKGLLAECVPGNPDRESPADLAASAGPLVREQSQGRLSGLVERCEEALGKGHGSTQLEQILTQAQRGRIESLLLAQGAEEWGEFDERTAGIEIKQRTAPRAEELLNAAAVMTMQHGGEALVLPAYNMPQGAAAASIDRY